MMFLTFVLFSSLAYLFYYEAEALNDFDFRYDDKCTILRGTNEPCEVSFTPDVDLENPKVFYRLDNFYQNHRSFQKYDFKQLRGEDNSRVSKCDPVETNKDMLEDIEKWPIVGYPDELQTPEKAQSEAWPCGFIAKFAFSDGFTSVKSVDRSFSVEIDDSNIAHDVDVESRFIRNNDKWEDGSYWRDVAD